MKKYGYEQLKGIGRRLRIPLVLFLLWVPSLHTHSFPVSESGDDRIVKVLAIGNSFSADAVENYFHEMAREKNIGLIVGNLYIGGAPLSLHLQNARENKPAYSFRKTDVNGIKSTIEKTSLESALTQENWDIISFQQASPLSGQFDSILESLPALAEYVGSLVKNPGVKFVYHQTWAYSIHSVQPGFTNYGFDQRRMYQAIVDVSRRVAEIAPVAQIIPAGTAIQNARTSYIGDNFDRDGYHLRIPLGRYVAACTWFESLFGIPATTLKFRPDEVSETEKKVAQAAAHYAVQNPYQVTPLNEFRRSPKKLRKPKAPILVDFGGVSHEGPWNPVWSPLTGKLHTLQDSLKNLTRIELEILERFHSRSGGGNPNPENIYHFPPEVTSSGLYGNKKTEINNLLCPQSEFRLTGLQPGRRYDLVFYSSNPGNVEGVELAQIVCKGAERRDIVVNASVIKSSLATFSGVRPASDGSFTVLISAAEGNTTAAGLFRLNAMRLKRSQK